MCPAHRPLLFAPRSFTLKTRHAVWGYISVLKNRQCAGWRARTLWRRAQEASYCPHNKVGWWSELNSQLSFPDRTLRFGDTPWLLLPGCSSHSAFWVNIANTQTTVSLRRTTMKSRSDCLTQLRWIVIAALDQMLNIIILLRSTMRSLLWSWIYCSVTRRDSLTPPPAALLMMRSIKLWRSPRRMHEDVFASTVAFARTIFVQRSIAVQAICNSMSLVRLQIIPSNTTVIFSTYLMSSMELFDIK